MAIVDALLPEFDHEMAVARKVLERVDGARLGWKPHEKSMSLGRLATHVAEIPQWSRTILTEPEFNMVDGEYRSTEATTTAEVLDLFDGQVKTARAILVGRHDSELAATWTFKQNGQELFSMPRVAAWRTFIMSHLIHHRGQLSVYLRLTGAKVPGIYGPSADES
jgi:uncharacterized damage-inducible protein DinB